MKICVCGVDSMLKLNSKITVTNNWMKLDDGSYLSLENLEGVLVSSSSYSDGSNFDLECLEHKNVAELKASFKS